MRPDDASERVENGVWVGSHVNAVSFGVITDVYDDGEKARIKHMAQSLCHSGSADPASKQGYAVIAVSPN